MQLLYIQYSKTSLKDLEALIQQLVQKIEQTEFTPHQFD